MLASYSPHSWNFLRCNWSTYRNLFLHTEGQLSEGSLPQLSCLKEEKGSNLYFNNDFSSKRLHKQGKGKDTLRWWDGPQANFN